MPNTRANTTTLPRSSPPASDGLPVWLQGGTIYGIITSRVGAGTFCDVMTRLDDLADLGIAALWVAPVTKTLSGHFGYEVTDYFDVRPEYGTIEDLRALVAAAHERNIRVLLDVVPNHTSIHHPWFQTAERDGHASPFFSWYDRDDTGAPTSYFDWTHLPNLNLDHPDVREAITEAMLFWVRECDIDGFRVDVAWGIRQRRPDFWLTFVQAFRALKPDGLLIAEASAHDPYYLENGFDLVYDWTPDLGHWAWDGAFDGLAATPSAIRAAVDAAIDGTYDPTTRTLRFLNNNDTGIRFITRHGKGMYRVALALLMTLPGVPCLYLGDEFGAEYEPYGPVEPLLSSDDGDLRSYVRSLVRLRRDVLADPSLHWSWLHTSDNDAVLSYLIKGNTEPVIVLLNFSDTARLVAIHDHEPLGTLGDAPVLSDRLSGTEIAVNEGLIPLAAWGARVLAPVQVKP
jgi:glycosidase